MVTLLIKIIAFIFLILVALHLKKTMIFLEEEFVDSYQQIPQARASKIINYFAWALIVNGVIVGVFFISDEQLGLSNGSVVGAIMYVTGSILLIASLERSKSK